jgi:BlaI family transcriptional regulator, penicillinase repressor
VGRPGLDHPTELELQILKILWDKSPERVRSIRQELANRGRSLAHTSVITMLNIMVRKRYLKRTKRANAFLFEPIVTRESVSRRMLGDMVKRVFDGSAKKVLLALFDASEVGADELQEIRRYINRKAREQAP